MIIAFKRVEVQHQVFKRRLKILCIDIDFEGGREGAHWFWEEGPSKGERGVPSGKGPHALNHGPEVSLRLWLRPSKGCPKTFKPNFSPITICFI